jgi:hypothetical protein
MQTAQDEDLKDDALTHFWPLSSSMHSFLFLFSSFQFEIIKYVIFSQN